MADPKTLPSFLKKYYKDFLAIIGLALLGWGLERIGGRTLLIIFSSILCLALSGLLHIVVAYIELHVVNSLRLIIHKVEPQQLPMSSKNTEAE